MRETAEDIAALQALLDRSYASAGRHLRNITTPERRVLPAEEFAVNVHGRAVELDIRAAENAAFRQTLLDIYVPRYGPEWETSFLDNGPVYLRIDADKMFTFTMRRG